MTETKERILITAYSYSGITEELALRMQLALGGDFKPIIPYRPYPKVYSIVMLKGRNEIRNKVIRKLKDQIDVSDYDTIFVGSPNWFGTIAPPVYTFLTENDFTGKKVIPFATHGGSGEQNCLKDIVKHAKGAIADHGFSIFGNGVTDKMVHHYLKKIGYL